MLDGYNEGKEPPPLGPVVRCEEGADPDGLLVGADEGPSDGDCEGQVLKSSSFPPNRFVKVPRRFGITSSKSALLLLVIPSHRLVIPFHTASQGVVGIAIPG